MRPSSTPARSLAGLAERLGLAPADGEITGITHDSRKVRPGDLYVALSGATFHGASFAGQAARDGAAAILTDERGRDLAERTGLPVLIVEDVRAAMGDAAAYVWGDPAGRLLLVGVTGTAGKTTTAYLMEAGLQATGLPSGVIGTVETRLAGERLPSALTTPEATELHAIFATAVERGVGAIAMEVSSHALEQGRVDGAVFDVALFTNLSQDHLDYHPTMQDYFAAKAKLFTAAHSRIGVVNLDDEYGRQLAEIAEVPVTTYSPGGDRSADWWAEDVRLGADGSVFRVVGPGGIEADASVGIPGPFNVANALGAIVALVEAGLPLHKVVDGIGRTPGVPGRLQRVDEGQEYAALVDYAHKPGAVEAILATLRPVTRGKLIIVLGCGGDRDKGKRPLMGEASARLADVVLLTNDNPRSEDPLSIVHAMIEGVLKVPESERAELIVHLDRAAAIREAVSRAATGDVLVVAGKGHEQGQYTAGRVIPFDDREVLARSIREASDRA